MKKKPIWVKGIYPVFVLLLAGAAVLAHGAGAPECADYKPADRPKLIEKAKAQQTRLDALLLKVKDVTSDPDELRQAKASMLDITFRLACTRSDLIRDELLIRGPADSPRTFITIPVFYSTNRKPVTGAAPAAAFNAETNDKNSFGQALISVPTNRKPGELNLPTLWKFETSPDAFKHFILRPLIDLKDEPEFAKLLGGELGKAKEKTLFLFVHGYRVSFEEAALRTAQMAHDLRFQGVAMFYSWPSAGSIQGYWHDEEAVQLAEPRYDELLESLGRLPFKSIYVLAHSMGNRLVANVHKTRLASGKNLGAIQEVMMAAADINAQIFNQNIAPALAAKTGPRTTIYASSNDVALIASKVVHSFARLGDTKPNVYRRAPFDTIDASTIAPLARAFGHSYIFDNREVIADLQELILMTAPDDRQNLQRIATQMPAYWRVKPAPKP